jgi:hypothetical protein
MSAEMLREAAALMRSRAANAPPFRGRLFDGAYQIIDTDDLEVLATVTHGGPEWDHIASWHPAVALAVADWLDDTATANERLASSPVFVDLLPADHDVTNRKALAVARAYLNTKTLAPSPDST